MTPPLLSDHIASVLALLSQSPAGLVTDVDGTISPIVDRHEMAGVDPRAAEFLRRLALRLELVAIVSGRPLSQLRHMVDVDGAVYVGNHGLEWWMDGRATVVPEARPYLPAIADAVRCLRDRLDLPGVIVEDKGATATIHYRLSPDSDFARRAILDAVAQCPSAQELRVAEGRMVVNLLPPIPIDKGTAIERLIRLRNLRGAIYFGDDVTDVDAFRALRSARDAGECAALNVAVVSSEAPPELLRQADYQLAGVDAVVSFLGQAADWLERQSSSQERDRGA